MLGKPPQQHLCSLFSTLTCLAGTAFSAPPQQAEAGAVFWKVSQWVGWKLKSHISTRGPQELRNQNHFQLIWGGTLNSNSEFRKKRFLQELLEEPLLAITVAARQRKGLLWCLGKTGVSACADAALWLQPLSLMLMLIRCIDTSGHWGKTDILALSPDELQS